MKNEPLKNKMFLDTPEDYKVFGYDNIKSAVEWLKEEINKRKWEDSKAHSHVPNETINIRIDVLMNILDKAFEDVMKNE